MAPPAGGDDQTSGTSYASTLRKTDDTAAASTSGKQLYHTLSGFSYASVLNRQQAEQQNQDLGPEEGLQDAMWEGTRNSSLLGVLHLGPPPPLLILS